MSQRFPVLLLAAVVLLSPVRQLAAEPANLDVGKEAVQRYVGSGEYGKDIAAVALKANRYLTKRLAKPPPAGKKYAVVFDIDETTLSNLPHMTAQDFGYVPAVWKKWVADGRAPAIVPIQIIYDLALRRQVAVFFITSRRESERASTERNLRQVGYESWTKAYFASDGSGDPVRLYKTARRRDIEAEGYVIVANLGDQDSDLQGGHAERTFKLPNPFYLMK